MHDNTAITLKNLSIGYVRNRHILPVADVINATLHRGEFVALMGSNGTGKSTLLRTISAFQAPLGGSIIYPDGSSEARNASDLSRMIAVVLTDNNHTYSMPVHEVVALGRTPYTGFTGRLSNADRAVVENAMELAGISRLAMRDINTLSDGERQKVMIAKALAQETPVIILDEPTAFLDFGSKIQLFRSLKQLASKQNKAIIVSTHDISPALRLADKIWLLHEGRLHCGSVKELAEEGTLQKFIDNDGIRYDKEHNMVEII